MLSRIRPCEQELVLAAETYGKKALEKKLAQQKKELSRAQARRDEIAIFFKKIYEDNALGKLTDQQYTSLHSGYEQEAALLDCRISELSQQITETFSGSRDEKNWMEFVHRHTMIKELTYENIHEWIDRILIYEPDKETNTRRIEIYYSCKFFGA